MRQDLPVPHRWERIAGDSYIMSRLLSQVANSENKDALKKKEAELDRLSASHCRTNRRLQEVLVAEKEVIYRIAIISIILMIITR